MLRGSAEQANGAQQDDQVGHPYEAISVEVSVSTIRVTTKVPEEHDQVCGTYQTISCEVGGASHFSDFADFHEPIAVVVDAFVGARCSWVLQGVVVVAVADVVVGVIVVVDDARTGFKCGLAVVVNASVTGRGAAKGANGGAVVQYAIGLLRKAVDAPSGHGGKQDGGFVREASGGIGIERAVQTGRGGGNVHLRCTVAEQHEVVLIALGLNGGDRIHQGNGHHQTLKE